MSSRCLFAGGPHRAGRLFLATLGLALLATHAMAWTGPHRENEGSPNARPLIIGHRGSPGFGGENALVGLRRAVVDLKADGFEIDLLLTEDDRLLVGHDWELTRLVGRMQLEILFPARARMIGGRPRWFVRDLTLDELRQLVITYPAPGVQRANYTLLDWEDYHLPSFEEVLDLFEELRAIPGNQDLKIYVELKTDPSHTSPADVRHMVRTTVETLKQRHLHTARKNVWIQSFDPFAMQLFAEDPDVEELLKTQLDSTRIKDIETDAEWRSWLRTHIVDRNLQAIHVSKLPLYRLLVERGIEAVAIAHDLGLQLHVFTFRDLNFYSDYANNPDWIDFQGFASAQDELQFFYAHGVDAVMLDYVRAGFEALRGQHEGRPHKHDAGPH